MHELSIAEALLKTLKDYVGEHGGQVTKLSLTLGRLCGADSESLMFAWPLALAANGSAALANCALEIESPPLTFSCRSCGKSCEAVKPIFVCPACGDESLIRSGGRELMIRSIEVETDV